MNEDTDSQGFRQLQQLQQLAQQLYQQGNYEEAIGAATQARELAHQLLDENDPQYAAILNFLATLYQAEGNDTAAEPLFRQALDIVRRAFGEEHPDVAPVMYNLAMVYEAMGNDAAAEPLFRQALDIATAMYNLAELYYDQGNYTEAEPLLNRAVEIRRHVFGEEHPAVADSLNALAMVYHAESNYAAAEPLLTQAMHIMMQLVEKQHPGKAQSRIDLATYMHNLGGLYRTTGNYAPAEPLLTQALEIRKDILGEQHPQVAKVMNELAAVYYAMGNYAAAEPLFRKAMEVWRDTVGEQHLDYARALNDRAMLYRASGNYAAAKQLLTQAMHFMMQLVEKQHFNVGAQSRIAVAAIGQNLAGLYRDEGNYAEAKQLLTHVLDTWRAVRGENSPDYAECLNNLALLYHAEGNYAAAEPLLRQALEIRDGVLEKQHPAVANSLNNLALLYHAEGNYAAAEPLLRQALQILRQPGDLQRQQHPDVARVMYNLAELYAITGRESQALVLMTEASAITDRMIGHVFSFGSEAQRMGYLQEVRHEFYEYLSLIHQYAKALPQSAKLALDLVLRRKAVGAEALASQRDAVLGGRYPALSDELGKLRTLNAQIASKTLTGPGPEGLDAHLQLLARWKSEKEDLESYIAREIPEMDLSRQLREAGSEAVAVALPTGSALVEFVYFPLADFKTVRARGEQQWKPARYLAFVLLAGHPDKVAMVDLGEAEQGAEDIDRLIGSFTATINRHGGPEEEQPHAQANGEQAGNALRAALFDPLQPLLGDCRRLFISPDGELSRLPLEILPTPDGHRLIDDYEISYLSVGRDVLRFRRPGIGKSEPPIVAADPDFDLVGSSPRPEPIATPNRAVTHQSTELQPTDRGQLRLHFDSLKGTKLEGKRVAELLNVQPLLGPIVLKGQLMLSRSPHTLHIATHGFFLEDQKPDPNKQQGPIGSIMLGASPMERLVAAGQENPLLRSGLALAGANRWFEGKPLPQEAGDGMLNALDVSGLDLLDTELVVLSACDTGLGEIQVGEGVFGLRRSFVLAGAKTLVMSLWKVPDKQTQELMVEFYERLLQGQPRADALRQAQLVMKARHPEPLYWGAFICQGDPGPLTKSTEEPIREDSGD